MRAGRAPVVSAVLERRDRMLVDRASRCPAQTPWRRTDSCLWRPTTSSTTSGCSAKPVTWTFQRCSGAQNEGGWKGRGVQSCGLCSSPTHQSPTLTAMPSQRNKRGLSGGAGGSQRPEPGPGAVRSMTRQDRGRNRAAPTGAGQQAQAFQTSTPVCSLGWKKIMLFVCHGS